MVIQSFLPVLGGAQRQVAMLGPVLARRGIETTVVTRRPPGTPRSEQLAGLEVRRMPGPDRGAIASIAYTGFGSLALARFRPDVIHVHDLLSPSTIALLSRPVTRAPIVAKVLSTGPGGDIDRLLTKPLGRRRLEAMARRFAAFVCLSPEVADELATHGVSRDLLHYVPNGVDTDHFRPPSAAERAGERAGVGIGEDRVVALYAGRFETVKRLDLLIAAAERVQELHLVLVGEGDEESRLRREIAERGLADRVTLLPRADDPAPLYRAADVYVSASSTEGMSNSVLEAMASGLPIVAAEASGMEELVVPNTGSLVPGPIDAEMLAAALTPIAANPQQRRRLGAGARARVEDRFSLEATAGKLCELYAEVRSR